MINRNTIFPALVMFVLASVIFAGGTKESEHKAFDWPGWRGPKRDGISEESDWYPEALSGGAKLLWKVDIGRGHSNVAVVKNRLYTMGSKEMVVHVYCLEASTGREIWRHRFEKSYPEPNSTPVVDGNRVYALSGYGTLLCLNATNGKIRWQKSLNRDFKLQPISQGWSTSPLVVDELLLVNASAKQLALDKNTGNTVWLVEDEKPRGSFGSYASPVVYDDNEGRRYVLFMGPGNLNAVKAATGKKLWSFTHNDPWHPIADPVVSGSKVFISIHDTCYMLEMDGSEPQELWSSSVLCSDIATAVMVDGFLYGSHFADRYLSTNDWNSMRRFDWPLRCVNPETGEVVWEENLEHSVLSSADGKLILLGVKGTLYIAEASPKGYNELARADISRGKKQVVFATPPVLCNGKIYCRNFWGDLICIDVSR